MALMQWTSVYESNICHDGNVSHQSGMNYVSKYRQPFKYQFQVLQHRKVTDSDTHKMQQLWKITTNHGKPLGSRKLQFSDSQLLTSDRADMGASFAFPARIFVFLKENCLKKQNFQTSQNLGWWVIASSHCLKFRTNAKIHGFHQLAGSDLNPIRHCTVKMWGKASRKFSILETYK